MATLRAAVRDFRAGKTGLFATPRPGPTTAPAKDAARPTIIGLRQQGLSATEISQALAGTPTPLNRTGVAEVLREEVCHVDDLAADAGAGLFACLVALPTATALCTYSYRLSHARQVAFLGALGQAMLQADLVAGRGGDLDLDLDLDLDFHAIMHWGEDVALQRHDVPARSQRTRSARSVPGSAGGSPATRRRPPTPSSAASCRPAASSSTRQTPSSCA